MDDKISKVQFMNISEELKKVKKGFENYKKNQEEKEKKLIESFENFKKQQDEKIENLKKLLERKRKIKKIRKKFNKNNK